MSKRRSLILRIILFTCGAIIGLVCLLLIVRMLWSSIVPCNHSLPVSFTINDIGKPDKQIAEEVFSRYLDQSVFPHSCPDAWILQYRITDVRGGAPVDQMVWLVSYEISPFPANDYSSGNSLPNGNISEFRIFTLKKEGNIYSIVRIASGGWLLELSGLSCYSYSSN